ncbi:hypothetical protein QTG54_009228 [Skeletonema marinoi]|uniref:Uncharacterized protein n=1 Tax=Skeletonema marinoi TaxID=267567 RepID=A0AAD9DC12_9STRA|nr:hypothetical protein QTG54_009228 [Skeletonema marinoi]
MFPTDGTILTVSPDDAQPSAVVDDNILTDDELPPTSSGEEESNELPADYSSLPETLMMTSNAENEGKSAPEAETVDKTPTLSSDQQKVSNEPTGIEEEFQDENQAEVQLPSEDNVSTELDTSCAEKATATINEERQEEIIEERTDTEGCVDDTFVSVELSSSPSKNNSSYEEVGGQQEQEPLIDAASVSDTAAATVLINPSSEVAATDAAMASYVSSDNDDVAAASKSSFNISSQPPTTTTTTTTRRRKILHHPILSHLTKLPWDRLSNAGSACDVLFNCKYSMKQVEDEVREECRRGVSGEGVYIENDGVGREDGYVNVSLNSCSDYQYQEEGCETGEFEQILGCCSMLDNDEETDDEEEDVECVLPENYVVASEKAPHLVQPMIGLEGSHATVYTNQEEGEEEREYSGDNRVNSNGNELQQQQQSEKSWQQANPSLDMMLYRQFLNE